MSREPMTTVVVGDDHPMYRQGVVRAMKETGRIDVLAEAGDGRARRGGRGGKLCASSASFVLFFLCCCCCCCCGLQAIQRRVRGEGGEPAVDG